MNQAEFLAKLAQIIDDAQAAVLATVDDQGHPCLRWMTPTLLHGRHGALFALTIPGSRKTRHLQWHPEVQWLLQTRSLSEIVSIHATAAVIDNPALRTEVFESLGPRLTTFWRVNPDRSDFVVLESRFQNATYFRPMAPQRLTISFA